MSTSTADRPVPTTTREVHLASRPQGAPTPGNFRIVETAIPELADGEVLVANSVMSVDPYMRGRMNDVKSYVPPFAIDAPLDGGAVGTVIASRSDDLAVGTWVLHGLGWREHAVLEATSATAVASSSGSSSGRTSATSVEGQAKTRGDFAAVHVCPEENGDIPDTDEARLVILHPRVSHRKGADSTARAFAHQATEHRGTSNRTYRNMIVFLAADEARLEELDNAVRDYLGWSHVLDNADDLDLTQSQQNQATDRRRSADETVTARLLGTYQWALTPDQPDPSAPFVIGATKVEGQAAGLAERVSKKLGSDGHLSIQQAAQTIRMRLDEVPAIWSAGHVSLGSLWQSTRPTPTCHA